MVIQNTVDVHISALLINIQTYIMLVIEKWLLIEKFK